MFRKVLFLIVGIVAAALLTAAAGWLKAVLMPPESVIPETAELSPSGAVPPGAEITCRAEMTLPINRRIAGAKIVGADLAATAPEYRFVRWKFDRGVWEVTGVFRLLKTGRSSGGALTVSSIALSGGGKREFTVPIPEITGEIPPTVKPGADLILSPDADDLPGQKAGAHPHRRKLLLYAAAAVLAAAVLIVVFFRRRKQRIAALPLDERTIRAIRNLCGRARRGEIGAEAGFAGLCDIVREYLEQRFGMPVTRRTTVEFIRDLAGTGSVLSDRERLFLTEFMNTADLIKFAGECADDALLDRAGAGAEELVRATAVQPEEKP